jgi:hypothetical protein
MVPLSTLQKLADRWPTLTTEELDATHGRPDLIAAILSAKAGYAELLTREALGQSLREERAAASRWATIWPKVSVSLIAAGHWR